MRTKGDELLEEKFKAAFSAVEGLNLSAVSVKAAYGLITFRGNVSSKKMRLKMVTLALAVMDEVLGEGRRRIVGNPR